MNVIFLVVAHGRLLIMNAIEFVKQNGVEKAKQIVDLLPMSTLINIDGIGVSISELKQIVEAFELVEYCNGLEDAKELLDEIDSERWVYNLYTNTVISSDYSPCDNMCIKYDVLKQAIELVERVL